MKWKEMRWDEMRWEHRYTSPQSKVFLPLPSPHPPLTPSLPRERRGWSGGRASSNGAAPSLSRKLGRRERWYSNVKIAMERHQLHTKLHRKKDVEHQRCNGEYLEKMISIREIVLLSLNRTHKKSPLLSPEILIRSMNEILSNDLLSFGECFAPLPALVSKLDASGNKNALVYLRWENRGFPTLPLKMVRSTL